jgi:hypothetical protein
MTTLGRLLEKGLLGREHDGKRYVYRAKMRRDEFTELIALESLGFLWLGARIGNFPAHRSSGRLGRRCASEDRSSDSQTKEGARGVNELTVPV